MRGDSVRDLYAKALALLGLAVLAGAGALVDYWPVQGSFPVVSFSYSQPSPLAPLAARVALASPVAVALAQPRVTAPPVVAAAPVAATPLPAETEMRVVTVAADESVAAPTPAAEIPAPTPAAVASPVADPFQTTVSDTDPSFSLAVEPMAAPKVSHSDDLVLPPSTNVFQKAGNQVLNVGFSVGTGLAKSFSAFGTAFGNIGKLFIK